MSRMCKFVTGRHTKVVALPSDIRGSFRVAGGLFQAMVTEITAVTVKGFAHPELQLAAFDSYNTGSCDNI